MEHHPVESDDNFHLITALYLFDLPMLDQTNLMRSQTNVLNYHRQGLQAQFQHFYR